MRLEKAVEATAPTRIDLAGGTVDLWPLYLFHPDAVTVNAAIDLCQGTELGVRAEDQIDPRSGPVERVRLAMTPLPAAVSLAQLAAK